MACQNCEWTGGENECDELRDVWSRVEPGDVMPAGGCPKCGAAAMLKVETAVAPAPAPEIVDAYTRVAEIGFKHVVMSDTDEHGTVSLTDEYGNTLGRVCDDRLARWICLSWRAASERAASA